MSSEAVLILILSKTEEVKLHNSQSAYLWGGVRIAKRDALFSEGE